MVSRTVVQPTLYYDVKTRDPLTYNLIFSTNYYNDNYTVDTNYNFAGKRKFLKNGSFS